MSSQPLELTAAQRDVWTALQVTPDNPAFNIGWSVDFHDMTATDVDRLVTAIERVVRAADALHVTIGTVDGEPRQWPGDAPAEIVSRIICDEDTARVHIAADLDTARRLDGPLFTQCVFDLGGGRVRWFQGYHHIVVDAAAVRLLTEAVAAVYNGETPPIWSLRALVGDDTDYRGSDDAARDREAIDGLYARVDEMVRLGDPAGADTDTVSGTADIGCATLRLPPSAEVLADHPRTFAAALALYVHRMSGRRDIAVSMAVHNRSSTVRRREIGMVSRTHPVATTIMATDRVDDVRAALDPVWDTIRDHGRADHSPLFGASANLMFWRTPVVFGAQQVRLRGIRLGPVHDIDVAVESEPGMGVVIDVRGPAPLVERHRDRLRDFLGQLDRTTAAHAPVLVRGTEAERILRRFNDTAEPHVSRTVPDMFSASARAHADSVALVDGARTMTYGELDTHVRQLAAELRGRGLQPEQTVGIAISRSLETVVGALAVMSAGGAFVPLDPVWPAGRRRDVADSARLAWQLVRTDEDGRSLDIDGVDALVVDVDRWRYADRPTGTAASNGIRGACIAYVMFTSGSTGTPKGAMIRHDAICARLAWQIDRILGFGSSDAALFKAPLSFDISVNEFLLPLLCGGRVVIAGPGDERDPHRLLDLIEAHGVTFVYLVSSMLDILLDLDAGRDRLAGLRHVWCGGEVLTPSLFARFRDQLSTTLYHGYGPAEATIGVSHVIYRDTAERIATSIGRPNPNTQLYVLDDNLAPLPVGVRGELYAAGHLLGRGYVGAPGQTASRFIANPFGAPGTRLYRTGDRARWNADGTLEFAGRTDNQVKIRGMRLELDEVEAVLAGHPAVRHCAVITRRHSSGGTYLAGYVIPADSRTTDSGTLDAPALRAWMRARLPEYMVPTAFGILDEFPLTANGKLDRRSLDEPVFAGTAGYRAPASPAEAQVCADFARVLGRDRAGADDDFFATGGDSVLGVRLAAAIGTRTGRRVPVAAVFTHRTPAGLAQWLAEQPVPATGPTSGAAPHPPIRAADELSDAQRRMLLLHRLAPDSATYTVPITWRFEPGSTPDPATLELALRDVCARHDILRTVYPDLETPTVIPPDGLPPLLTESAAPPDPGTVVFDLATQIPVRAWWSADDAVLTVAFAHIAVDDQSEKVFRHDLAVAYDARATGRTPDFAPLATSYADHTRRVRRDGARSDDPAAPAHRTAAYWRRALADPPTAGISEPIPVGAAGAVIPFTLPTDDANALRATATRTRSSMFMLCHAATALTVSAMTGNTDVLVAAPVSLRTDAAVDALVGCFLNTLILRTDLSGHRTLADRLEAIRTTDLAAYDHQDLSYEDVVEVCGLTPAQLPQAMSIYLPPGSGAGDLELGGATGRRGQPSTGTAKFPITFTITEADADTGSGGAADAAAVHGTLEYATGVIDPDLAQRYVTCFLAALRTLGGDLTQADGRRPLTDPAELSTTTLAWAHGPRRPDPGTSLTELVAAGLRNEPSAIAIRTDGRSITRGNFDTDVDALAARLADRGVGPESVVGVHLPRSYELILAIAAIHRAGGAYLPLDPSLPERRLQYIIDDARPSVVLAVGTTPLSGVDVLDPGERSAPTGPPPVVRDRVTNPDAAAYVIYTSGSTGRPKGTVVSHRSAVNRLRWMRDEYGVTADDRILQKTPAGFDVSVWEIFLPLLTGARMVIADPDAHTDPHRIRDVIDTEAVTITHFVPSMLDAYLAALPTGDENVNPSLRLLVSSGEALGATVADRARKILSGITVANLYGPTEAAVDVTAHLVTGDGGAPVPIGRPIDNTTTYVLDHLLRPVPAGAPGDLYLGGVQLARGYPGVPSLTASRFVADPFSTTGQRLYRTGDRARWNASGALVYLGRDDDQVKINGLRIELGEVTDAIARLPGVTSAATLVVNGMLVGYVVLASPGGADWESSLRTALATSLPRHMIPARFVALDALPTTPNGKLDRRALPAPGDDTARAGDDPPRGDAEAAVARIVTEVMGIDAIGRERSILDLGAHSLTAIRILSRLRRDLGIRLPLGRFLADPTIAAVGRYHTAAVAPGAPTCDAPAHGAPTHGASPAPHASPDGESSLSPGQLRMWVDEQRRGPTATYTIPLVFRHRLGDDRSRFADIVDRALCDVLQRHEILRTVYPVVDGRPRAHTVPTPDTVVEHTARTPEELCRGTFALESDVPVRAFVSPTHIVILIHHIAFDEWSRDIFLADLSVAVAARRAGQEPRWPAPAPQYLRSVATGEIDPADIDAARRAVQGLPASTELPRDRDRPEYDGGARPGGVVHGVLDAPTVAGLRAAATDTAATTSMVTSAVTAALVHAVGAADDVALGMPVAQRDSPGAESAIGYFLNTLVLRVDLTGHPTFRSLLDRVRAATLSAYDLAHVPFDRVVAASAGDGDRVAGTTPFFDVMVVHQNATGTTAAPDLGADLTPETITTGTAKFDLLLEYTEDPDSGTIALSLEYAADVFDHATAAALMERLSRIAGQVAAQPDTRLADLDVLDTAERDALRHWNDTTRPAPAATLVDLLDEQVRRTPGACAIRGAGRELTFAKLAAHSTDLALHLQTMGAGPGAVVGVCVPRSPELLVALMAVVRSGAAYLPLDPDYPADRLRYMAADARPVAVIGSGGVRDLVDPTVPVVEVPVVDPAAPRTVRADGTTTWAAGAPTIRAPHPDDLVYVIYTSGSTGRPKGVGNTHRALVSHLRWMQDEYALGADDVVLQKTPAGFDVSVWEFFLAATVGACTVLADPGGHRDPAYLHRTIREHRVTTIHFVPPMLGALLTAEDLSDCSSLQRIICSGEALPVDVAQAARRALPAVRLDNLYGPTEAAIDVTRHTVGDGPAGTSVPIGTPVANTRLRILDRELRQVAPGVTGELYLAGTQLARGYTGRADLTAARFVADPYSARGERMYRTGDIARWTRTGSVEYLGRGDDQVKIRGQRIELGEVAAVITEHCPAVTQAVAVVRDGQIVAYTVGTARADEVLAAVQGFLPDHMRPAAAVPMASLPLTPNGKLDRRALPAPDRPTTPDRPATDTERALLEVLDRDLGLRMGPADDFFRNGGDSISAVLWAAKAAAAGFSFGVRDVFEQRTPAALAARFAPDPDPLAPTASAPAAGTDAVPVPLPPAVRRARKTDDWDRVFHARVRADDGLSAADLLAAESALRHRHEGLRLAIDTRRRTLWRARLVPAAVPDAEPLDWANGRGYRIDLADGDGGAPQIEVAVHGLIGDQHSADDLARAVSAHGRGETTDVVLHHIADRDATGTDRTTATTEGADQRA